MILVSTYLLIAIRIVAMILAAPVLGSRQVPLTIRLGTGLIVALLAFPLVGIESIQTRPPADWISAGISIAWWIFVFRKV